MPLNDKKNITYTTVRGRGEARFEEKHSVFIGYCMRTETEEAANAFIREIKEKHKDATHNVFGYTMQNGILCRYSDDGEPQGTAGKPILDILQRSGVNDVCVVVTRYFGGTLLGTGGLVHAYSKAAKLALDAAGISHLEPYSILQIDCSYSDYQKISYDLVKFSAIIDDVSFAGDVSVRFALRDIVVEEAIECLNRSSAGRASITTIGTRYDTV